MLPLGLLDLLLHRVERLGVGRVHLLLVGLRRGDHLVERGEHLVEAGGDGIAGGGETGDETDELVEFCSRNR